MNAPKLLFPGSFRRRWLLLPLVALLSVACEPQGPSPNPSPSPVALLCSTDAECENDLVCDKVRRSCVCTSDAACADTDRPFCNAFTGKCVSEVAGCTSNAECRADEYCNEALRACRPKKAWCEPCVQDEECGNPGDFCVVHPDHPNSASFCGSACETASDCTGDQDCLSTDKGKQCVPSTGRCSTYQRPCVPDSQQPCAADADCTAGTGQVCDVQLRRCVTEETSCAAGQVCDPLSLRCEQPCHNDAECRVRHEDAELVCLNRLCTRPDICESNDDCDTGYFCYREPGDEPGQPGACKARCVGWWDCPMGESCKDEPLSGEKVCQPGCTPKVHSGCPLNAICSDEGACKTHDELGRAHCQTRDACEFGERCIDSVCVKAEPECRTCSGGCGLGETCWHDGFNRACGSTTCPSGFSSGVLPSGSSEACLPELVHYCSIQICVSRSCPDGRDESCPKGFQCFLLGEGMAEVPGNYCIPRDPGICR